MLHRFLFLSSTQPGLNSVQSNTVGVKVVTNSVLFNELNNSLGARVEYDLAIAKQRKLLKTISPLQNRVQLNLLSDEVKAIKAKIMHVIAQYEMTIMPEMIAQDLRQRIKSIPAHGDFAQAWALARKKILKNIRTSTVEEIRNGFINALKNSLADFVNEAEINKRKMAIVRDYYLVVIATFVNRNKANLAKKITYADIMKILANNNHAAIKKFMIERNLATYQIDKIMQLIAIISPEQSSVIVEYEQIAMQLKDFSKSYATMFSYNRGEDNSLNYFLPNIDEPGSPFSHMLSNLTEKDSFKNAYQSYLAKLKAVDDLRAEQSDSNKVDQLISQVFSDEFNQLHANQEVKEYLNEVSGKFTLAPADWELILTAAKVFCQSEYCMVLHHEISIIKQVINKPTSVLAVYMALNELIKSHQIFVNFPTLQPILAQLDPIDLLPEMLHEYMSTPKIIAETEANLALAYSEIENLKAKIEMLKAEIISDNIDHYAANILRNCFARAYRLSADPACDKARNEIVADLLSQLSEMPFNNLVVSINQLLETHPNGGKFAEGLESNAFDTRLLQLLYNEGTPVGLFRASLKEIAVVGKNLAESWAVTIPVTQLTGEVVKWLDPADCNYLGKHARQQIRDIAKQNLRDMVTLLTAYKQAYTENQAKMPSIVNVDNKAQLLSSFVFARNGLGI